jgi:hypothetical protein
MAKENNTEYIEKRHAGSYDIKEICNFQKITNDNKN